MEKISILGCGWLGLPLALHLQKNHMIKGSAVHSGKLQNISERGISPFKIELSPELNSDFDNIFFSSDILIINFPPPSRDDIEQYHVRQIRSLMDQVKSSSITKVLFVSSTSVYPSLNRTVYETDSLACLSKRGKALLGAEKQIMNTSGVKATIVRFGGLIGFDRHPGGFLAGRKILTDGSAPVNLIHRDDCIGIIHTLIKNNHWGYIFNGCCPEHPSKKEFYEAAAIKGGYKIPQFGNRKENFKVISCQKLIQKTGYQFKYRNPLECL